ncbi:MAG: PIN domain-containing protein [Desulfosarcina sp.]|nr:PIN domain-containing protein [Desulfosarcina sp.]MBC2744455.1 PIN domain-containing protein [Desulfosarcina sp.]MBC2767363.1 type II toxin-antitoxin system VapC family toxin [Desulfosarcina sp.]
MRFLDTNIFIRYLTDDDPGKADACEKIFMKAVVKEETFFTTDMVIAEIVWVLESFYKLPGKEVQDKVEKILNTPNLICPHKDLILSALILYSEKNIDYIDAYNGLILKEKGIEELYSYDKHYDRIDWLKRLEP